MTLQGDFTFEDELLHEVNPTDGDSATPPSPASAPEPAVEAPREDNAPAAAVPPVIVVHERPSRGLLVKLTPPALILGTALAISSYQRQQPVRYLAPRPVVEVKNAADASPPEPAVADSPIMVRAEGNPEGSSKGEEVAKPAQEVPLEPIASPFAFNSGEGLVPFGDKEVARVNPFQPPAEPPVPVAAADGPPNPHPAAPVAIAHAVPIEPPVNLGPAPEPAPDAAPEPAPEVKPPAAAVPEISDADILRDIEREAAQKAAAKQFMQELKPKAQVIQLQSALEKVQSDRAAFRADLAKVLQDAGDDMAPAIEALSARYGRDLLPEVQGALVRIQRMLSARTPRGQEIALLRSIGVPEPWILDRLNEQMAKKIRTRGGPRNEKEAHVLAARVLLSLDLKNP